MEFNSFDELTDFYIKYLKRGNPKEVYFIMEQDNEDRLLGFVELSEKQETLRCELFTARLNFVYNPEYRAFYRLTFSPCIHFLLNEND